MAGSTRYHLEEISDLILVSTRSNMLASSIYLKPNEWCLFAYRPDQIGYMNPGRWRLPLLTRMLISACCRKIFLDGFIYNAKSKRDLTWFWFLPGYCSLSSVLSHSTFTALIDALAQALVSSKNDHELLRQVEERHRLLADNAMM